MSTDGSGCPDSKLFNPSLPSLVSCFDTSMESALSVVKFFELLELRDYMRPSFDRRSFLARGKADGLLMAVK